MFSRLVSCLICRKEDGSTLLQFRISWVLFPRFLIFGLKENQTVWVGPMQGVVMLSAGAWGAGQAAF